MDNLIALVFLTALQVQGTHGQTTTLTGSSTVQQGTDTVFRCNVNGGTATQYVWTDTSVTPSQTIYSGGNRFSGNSKYTNFQLTSETDTASVMTIENTAVEDEGTYLCSIPSNQGGNSNTLDVVVEVQSTRSLMLRSSDDNNEGRYIATCLATGGKPMETITWILNEETQSDGVNGNIIETTATLVPPLINIESVFTFPATLDNYGQTLVCNITGHTLTELNGQESVELNIHTSPSATGTTVTVDYATQGTAIIVSCNATNEPTPAMRNYYIYSNDILIHESTEGDNQVTVQDPVSGTRFTCLAGNYLGNTSLSEAVTYDRTTFTTELSSTQSTGEQSTIEDSTTKCIEEPIPCNCTRLSSGASAGIAVLTVLLVASIIINVIQFILLRRHETTPELKDSPETLSSQDRQLSSKANDNTAYEMVQSGDRAYTALKVGSSGSPISSVIAPENLMFFTRLGSIGRGDFGAVWKGVLRSDQGQVDIAIRQIPDQVNRSANVLQAVKVLCDLSDQLNVVKCLGYCQQQGSILYEFITGGTLLTHLQMTGVQSQPTYSNLKPNRVRIDEDSLLNFAWQIAKGMQFLTSKRIIHGTLCAHNVLLDERKKCKISDYGLASSLFSKTSKPTRWSSPETMVSGVISAEGDIWSFGIVLWEIVTLGARPYPNMTFDIVQKEVTNGFKMPCPRHCGQELYAIMSLCWENKPRNRSNFDRILKSLEKILEKNHNYLSLNNLDEGLYASAMDM